MPGGAWRDEAAAELVVRHLPALGLAAPVLVMEDPLPHVSGAAGEAGLSPVSWHRRARGGRPASAWPPPGPFGSVLLRLPRAKKELEMNLHAAASVVEAGGAVVVYGAGDEGIRSAERPLRALLGGAETRAIGNRCRLLGAERPPGIPGLRASLREWREEAPPPWRGLGRWVSYPGVFAHGRLDDGTRRLLEALPALPEGRVLDFGCGSGVVGAVVRLREPDRPVDLLDVDAVALEAARENVPGGEVVLGEGLSAVGGRRYAAVVSNPPFHRGKRESLEMIEGLVEALPGALREDGVAVLVAQRRLSLGDLLALRFRAVETLAEDRVFRVWRASRPVEARG